MRFLHISDLHLGKMLGHCSLLEDQQYMLFSEIIPLIEEKKADALLISGDIFQTANPSMEALSLYDEFLKEVRKRNVEIIAIAGNHDHRFKIEQHKSFLRFGGYHVSGCYDDKLDRVVLKDEYGPVNFYLLPYIHPSFVKDKFTLEESNYPFSKAVEAILAKEEFDFTKRNVILSHQMVTGSVKDYSDSKVYGMKKEESDVVSISLYDGFDYVALGHIHRHMTMKGGRVVYPGALLPYHVDETSERYVSFVELSEKGRMVQELIPVKPKRTILKLEEEYASLLTHDPILEDYVSITLLGEVKDPLYFARLQKIFPLLLSVHRKAEENEKTNEEREYSPQLDEFEVISQFYEMRMGKKMTAEEEKIVREMMLKAGGK